jgi:3,4-dihydroxy 2-butanone 4-phosphate synthase / GTP cyclohydrolase II
MSSATDRRVSDAPADLRLQPEVGESVAALRLSAGLSILLLDDRPGSTTGPQLVAAADRIGADQMAFLVRYSSGFVYVCLPALRCAELMLPIFANDLQLVDEPIPVVSVDAGERVSTGISAADRSLTARLLADPHTTPAELTRPGHVVPIRVTQNCRKRAEAVPALALDLCLIAGASDAAVLCDLVDEEGETMTTAGALQFAALHDLACVVASEVSSYRQTPLDGAGQPPIGASLIAPEPIAS